MFFISLHGVIINDALPLSFYDFFKHATIFFCLFSITLKYSTTITIQSAPCITTGGIYWVRYQLEQDKLLIQICHWRPIINASSAFLGAIVTKNSSKSGIPEAEVGPEEAPYLQDAAEAVWAR